jgi:hypothetical protein
LAGATNVDGVLSALGEELQHIASSSSRKRHYDAQYLVE